MNAVYPTAELMPRTLELAQLIVANPPLAVRYLKQGLNLSLDSSYRDIRLFERWAMASCRQSEDYKEAVRSFVEKRPTVFMGR
ncbi:MAG: enoyl-CoA hydratase-related protein [Dehalococcoidia bacterium]|nr:enoyl-CoA hydratase-related protein [Dehalococcoidia bacterium]